MVIKFSIGKNSYRYIAKQQVKEKGFHMTKLASRESEPIFLSQKSALNPDQSFTSFFSILSQFNGSQLGAPGGTEKYFLSHFCYKSPIVQ